MSYDIDIYQRDFFRAALESGCGDWTNATVIPEADREFLIDLCRKVGFVPEEHDPGFVAFLQQEGVVPSQGYRLRTSEFDAEFSVFPNSMSFSIHHSSKSLASITLCLSLARQASNIPSLAYRDPQSGESSL